MPKIAWSFVLGACLALGGCGASDRGPRTTSGVDPAAARASSSAAAAPSTVPAALPERTPRSEALDSAEIIGKATGAVVPPIPPHVCPAGVASAERAVIEIAGGIARFHRSTFALPDEDAEQRVEWQEDLDGDGLLDVAVFHGACGNHGECMYGVYAQCEGGVFVPVFEPEYVAGAPTPVAARDGGWRRLSAGASIEDPITLRPRVLPLDLRFEGGRYVPR